MVRYVALLRGINVSGQKIIKMDYLKKLFESMELQNVKTYIQSGNVIFDSLESEEYKLSEKIENYLQNSLGYKIIVFLRSLQEIREIIEQNPFRTNKNDQNTSLYVSFLSETPDSESKLSLISRNNKIEEFQIRNREAYCMRLKPNDGKTKFTLYSVEKILGMPTTTRNWTTINKLLLI
jgi:uncharacterized protein (DUF1697 family)